MEPGELAILKTVVYADLFDAPLRFEELCEGLFDVALEPDGVRRLLDGSAALAAVLAERDGYVFLRGREALLGTRRLGERRAAELVDRYRVVLERIARLPYVRLVALSGAAACENVHDDDVDLFVVTKAGRAWSACLFVTLLSRALGARKAICANYFLDEGSLALADRDLYTAHQLAHLKPLVGGVTYRALFDANRWVAEYFPSAFARARTVEAPAPRVSVLERAASFGLGALVEAVSRRALTANLRRKIPPGTPAAAVRLGPGRLKLHINDHRPAAMERFERALAAVTETAERATSLTVAGGRIPS